MRQFTTFAKIHLSSIYSGQEISHISRLLLEKIAGIDGIRFYSDKDMKIPETTAIKLREAVERLEKHEPLQYILGETEFSGLIFHVEPGVLIPRPETEELVEIVLKDTSAYPATKEVQVIDLCSGSGCIAITLAKRRPFSNVEGWDISGEALRISRQNAQSLNVSVKFIERDVLSFIPSDNQIGTIDLMVSNPPYVCLSEQQMMEPKVLDFEPHVALFVEDTNPLIFYGRLAFLGERLLKIGGCLYVEINSRFGKETAQVFEACTFSEVTIFKDMSGHDRFIRATR
ncbi:MAG: peptide chain release factor N(5)-glutamine methyltransferase [Bacteroidota bacterium]|nr:peptide chain release factor N(5)-glutamine methyltransferase [Bacteroidota bacterium]